MSVNINGEDKKIGLALSGGGFRAAAFHLGVFRKLLELNLLWKVDLLSCVSGGSIAGAYIVTRWGDDSVLDDLENFLLANTLDVSSLIWGWINPFKTSTDILAQIYNNKLFKDKVLNDFKNGPKIYINATNFATGNMFSFIAGANKNAVMSDYELGKLVTRSFPIAHAVAASSAFPPLYSPLKINEKKYPFKKVDYVTLIDGGVYDNLGINPLKNNKNKLDYIIVSDASSPSKIDCKPPKIGAIGLLKLSNIFMEQTRGLQIQSLLKDTEVENTPSVALFSISKSINGDNGKPINNDHEQASLIKTRLKKLTTNELSVLSRHGKALVYTRLKKYMPELI